MFTQYFDQQDNCTSLKVIFKKTAKKDQDGKT